MWVPRPLSSQVSFSYYGLEAQRILREGEEIKVMIRYPQSERNSISNIQDTRIITPAGAEVSLSEIAIVKLVDGVSSIRRENSNRTVNVWAAVNSDEVEPLLLLFIQVTIDGRRSKITKDHLTLFID